MSAHYEAHLDRDGITVRVMIDVDAESMYEDVDELAELATRTAQKTSREARLQRDAARVEVPF